MLVHGFAQCHLCFEPQYRSALAEHFRLVAYDMRGHGASEQPPDPAAYQGNRVWADDLAAVMAAKRLKRPVLVGWSMGGRVIRQYLINYGDAEIAGVNFVASQVIEEPRFRGPGAPKALPDRLTLEDEIDCSDRLPRRLLRQEAERSGVPPRARLQHARARRRAPGDRRLVDRAPLTIDALRKVRVPILITHGRQDTVVLPAAAEMTADTIAHARLSWFDDCGHSPFVEDAARFNDELVAFVESSRQP